jgi:hypothetical protein
MGNEYDYKGKHIVLQSVPRSEFEALRRFGDYTELQDGTLMRVDAVGRAVAFQRYSRSEPGQG